MMQIRIQQGRLDDLERYLGMAQNGLKRAASLTHRLLAFSRRQTLDPKPTRIGQLVLGMQELIQSTVGPATPVRMNTPEELWSALVDAPQLENSLLNLCINARDAMPQGGRILVEMANRSLDEYAARQHDLPPGDYLTLSVTDSGTGMPPAVIERAFEPFFTTKPIGKGTAWDCPWSMALSSNRADRSESIHDWAKALRSVSTCLVTMAMLSPP